MWPRFLDTSICWLVVNLKQLGYVNKLDILAPYKLKEIQLTKRIDIAQSTSKADIFQKIVMLSVWWNFEGIVYFELLSRNQTINSNVYCRQLMKLDKTSRKSGQNWQFLKTTYIFGYSQKIIGVRLSKMS